MALDIRQDLSTTAKIAAIQAFLGNVTGEPAQVQYGDGYVRIVLTENQKLILQNEIEKQLRAKPGKIRLNYGQLIIPPVARVYGKFAILALIAAFLLGSLTMPMGRE